jgi:hypothetical protein
MFLINNEHEPGGMSVRDHSRQNVNGSRGYLGRMRRVVGEILLYYPLLFTSLVYLAISREIMRPWHRGEARALSGPV